MLMIKPLTIINISGMMKSMKQSTESAPLTRPEKFYKRGIPAIGLTALALFGVYEMGQTTVNQATHSQTAQNFDKKSTDQDVFKAQLDKIASDIANPSDVVAGSTITSPGNHLSAEAIAFADQNKLDHQENGVDTLLETAVAISKANLIQPNSKFVISEVDVNGNGTKEAVLQVAPVDLPTLPQ